MYRVWSLVPTGAALLLAGAVLALVWANLAPGSYHDLIDLVLIETAAIGVPHGAADEMRRSLTLRFVVNDMLMALFFAIAVKEVWEAMVLPRGALRGRRAATPLIAAAGGMIAPALVYLGIVALLGTDAWGALARGWAVPMATDVALCYVVGRMVFGAGHPALRFLLVLAIADDLAAMAILALLTPSPTIAPAWLLVPLAVSGAVYLVFNRLPRWLDRDRAARPNTIWVQRRLSVWPYLAAGAVSWYGVQHSGLPPALGLVPVVPAIPHADRAFGLFSEAEKHLGDLLNRTAHLLRRPVAVALFLFGFCNAGIELGATGAVSGAVLAALLLGKPLGIVLFGWLAAGALRLGLPRGLRGVDLGVIGLVAGIGLTVPLFVSDSVFAIGPTLDGIDAQAGAGIGALASLSAAPVALVAARLLGVRRRPR